MTGLLPVIARSGPHFGEEAPLVRSNGSGTLFATHCNLLCDFCQKYEIKPVRRGKEHYLQ